MRTDSSETVKAKRATHRIESAPSDALFKQTLGKMLSTPPKPHDEMKKGAAPKRDPRSSGKGSKS